MKKKNYFIIDNDFLSKTDKKLDRNLTLTEAVIISYIASWGEKGYYGTQKTMAKKLFISDRTLRTHLSKLIEEGIILEQKNKEYDTKILKFNSKFKNDTIYNSEKDEEFAALLLSLHNN